MSTFDGVIKEYPLISIDCFLKRNGNFDSTSFFLSHCHKDHMKGLDSWSFYYHLKSRRFSKIYVSDVSSHLLKNDYEYEFLSEYLEVLPMEEPTVISLYDKDGNFNSRVVVTLLTAGHCLGSVMFFIEGNNGNILYTGDFRLPIGSSARLTSLHDENGCLKPLKSLYIDTTFCNASCLFIPSREECLNAIISIVEPWLSKGPSHIINLSCSYEYGYEFVFVELFKRFGVKTHVKEEKKRMYVGIKDIEDAVTSCASGARIHACALDRENLFKELSYPYQTPCGFVSPDEKPVQIIKIKPSAMFFKTNFFTRISWVDKNELEPEFHRVCYSTHSSLSEIRDMVHYLKPERVYPNVVVRQTEEHILSLIQSPTEAESSSLSPLGKLKSPPVHGNDFSSNENDSLPFFDECYEISKGKNKTDCCKKESHAVQRHGNICIDTDFDNTEEQETMLKEEIYLQKENARKDFALGQSPLKWHNPIISSDEEVFGNSSLDSPMKDKCDSDDAQGTSQESVVKSLFEEESKKISIDCSPAKSSVSSMDLNSPSQSIIGDHCGKYMPISRNIFPEQKPQLEMKYLEKEERNDLKESSVTKEFSEEKDVGKSPFSISHTSNKEMDGQLKSGSKENELKSSNLLSCVSSPHHRGYSRNILMEPSKSNTQCKEYDNVEVSAHAIGSGEKISIQEHKNIVNSESCVDIKTTFKDISGSKIHTSDADKPSTSKQHTSRSFHFIKKVDGSSDSEEEYSFKYVIKLPDKDKFNELKNNEFPNLDMRRLNANNSSNNCRIGRESSNPPDFTESHASLNTTVNNRFLNDEVDGKKVYDKAKESVSDIHLEEKDLTHGTFPLNMNEFKSKSSERNENTKENDLKIQMYSQCIGSAPSNAIIKLDSNKLSHIQNITQEPLYENIKTSSAMLSSPFSKSSVSEMTLSKGLNKDQSSQEPTYEKDNSVANSESVSKKAPSKWNGSESVCEKDNSFTFSETASKKAASMLNGNEPIYEKDNSLANFETATKKALSELNEANHVHEKDSALVYFEIASKKSLSELNGTKRVYEKDNSCTYSESASKKALTELNGTKIIKDENTVQIPVNKEINSPICFKHETTSKGPVLDQNCNKPLLAEIPLEPMNGIPNSLNSVHSLKSQNCTSFVKEQNFREMWYDMPFCAREVKSPTSKVVDLASDDEISVVGQMVAEKVKQPLAVKCEQSVTGIGKQIVAHKNKSSSQVLDLSSDDSSDEISIIGEETARKKKSSSTVIDLASDDSNDVFIINEKFTAHCKVLSPVQNLYTQVPSCLQNISCNKPSLNSTAVASNFEGKIENGFVKCKRNMSAREEGCHLYNENRCKIQRTVKEDSARNRVADGESRTVIMKPSNLNNCIYGAKSGQSLSKTSVSCSHKTSTIIKLNSLCPKAIERNAYIAQGTKSLNHISPTSPIIVEDINSSSDLDDSPSLLAPSFTATRGSRSSKSTFVHSCSYPKNWKMKYTDDFTLSKSECCDKLSNEIYDRYMKDSDSTPEDLV